MLSVQITFVRKKKSKLRTAQSNVQPETYWFPNSEATKRKPVFRTHMAAATGIVSKYFSLISVTYETTQTFLKFTSFDTEKKY